jgi:hypothetical protein
LGEVSKEEADTMAHDSTAMRYLSYVLYPLCVGLAVYSLVYNNHKRYLLKIFNWKKKFNFRKYLVGIHG